LTQDPSVLEEYLMASSFQRLPYALDRHRSYLEIGAGGGPGMMLAQHMGAERIVGVEINPGITAASLTGFEGFGARELTRDRRIELVTAEGRSWAENCDERFDTVTITFIQTGVANGSAAFALSEANLFTVEAFRTFLSLLNEDGLFYVYRQGGNEILRLVSMLREAMADFGVTDLRPHLYSARSSSNQAVLMVGRSPFTEEEVERLDRECATLGIDILYSPSGAPGERPPNPFPERVRELRASGGMSMDALARLYDSLVHSPDYRSLEASFIESEDPATFVAGYPLDITAPTDNRPYYFFSGLSHIADFALYFQRAGVQLVAGTVMLLFWMAVVFGLLVTLLILLPLTLHRTGGVGAGIGPAVTSYFSGLGLGYMAVQISFIQRFTLFLGHPVYAISVVLLAFLIFNGLGSAASDRLFRSGVLGFGRTIVLLVLILVGYNALLPAVFHSSAITWAVPAKIFLSALLIFPLAFLMGTLFPQGIRLVDRVSDKLTPWAWGANSAASVVGSIFALIFAIHFGFTATALVAGTIYVVLCWPAARRLGRG
jgi:hypothetical protein